MATVRRRTPPPQDDGKATVTETTTKQYIENVENQNKDNTSNVSDIPFEMVNKDAIFNQTFQNQTETTQPNTLNYIVNTLRELNIQTIYIKPTRQADMFNETFYRSVSLDENFTAFKMQRNQLQIGLEKTLQQINGNSGGRFKLDFYDINGNPVNDTCKLKDFVVANPVKNENENTQGLQSNNEQQFIMQLIRQQDEKMQRMFEQVQQMINNRQQPSEMDELAKEVLKAKLLGNDNNNTQSAENIVADIFRTQQMVDTLSNKFASSFNNEQEQPNFWGTEQGLHIIDKAGGVLEKMTNYIPLLLTKDKQDKALKEKENTTNNEMTEIELLVEDIINELQSDNELNENNAFLVELKTQYKTEYAMLLAMCKTQSFNDLIALLAEKAPAVFSSHPELFELTQQGYVPTDAGNLVIKRLEEFYNFMQTQEM